jgi:heat shock protein HslJ
MPGNPTLTQTPRARQRRAMRPPTKETQSVPRSSAVTAAAIAILALAACSTATTPMSGRLEGTAWRAESIEGKPVLDVQHPSTLRFFDRQLAGGSLGCNAYSTTFFADSTGLRFGEIAPTRKMCPAPVMEQESRFSAALQATSNARVDEKGALILIDAQGNSRARLLPMTP